MARFSEGRKNGHEAEKDESRFDAANDDAPKSHLSPSQSALRVRYNPQATDADDERNCGKRGYEGKDKTQCQSLTKPALG